MKSTARLRAIAMTLLIVPSAACQHITTQISVPDCARLIPPAYRQAVPPVDQPESATLPDGHDDARPWQVGFLGQTAQLGEANGHTAAVDHIYSECLAMHREAAVRSTHRHFLGL